MKIKIFKGKKIKIKKLAKNDLKSVKEFVDFVNSLVKEEAQILFNKKISLKEEKKWIKDENNDIKGKKIVVLLAKDENKIVGITDIKLERGRRNHIGQFGISIRNGYRGLGLGKYLMKEILKLAKKELKPKPKFIRLSVFSTNKIAQNLYKKFGFKQVARIPQQLQYKGKLVDEIVMIKKL